MIHRAVRERLLLLLPFALDAELRAALGPLRRGARQAGSMLGTEQHHDAGHRGCDGQDER